MGTKRQSNFELIRILAMVLIIIHHIFIHCVEPLLSQSDLFEGYEVYDRLMLIDFARSFGKIGVSRSKSGRRLAAPGSSPFTVVT